MQIIYYHRGAVGKPEVAKAASDAGHTVIHRNMDYFDTPEKCDAVVMDEGDKQKAIRLAYGQGKQVVGAREFLEKPAVLRDRGEVVEKPFDADAPLGGKKPTPQQPPVPKAAKAPKAAKS